jgi:uncharacterized OB-fold protein
MGEANPVFTARHVLAYDYRRSVGPVLGRFFAALRAGAILGSRAPGGRVLVPPMEYDPETGEGLGEDALVEVGPGGVVTHWAWVRAPRATHPLAHPFAFALVRLDGATSAMLHAVDAGSESRMRSGMRVRPRWRGERRGEIRDIECFVPEQAS